LRRYRGTMLNDEMSGNLVVYDNKTDKFTVDGAAGPSGAGRVRAMLTPRPAASAAGNAELPAPARGGASQAGPTLRQSTTMGGDRK
jgi:lipopolysaccharide export system protein LptA